MSVFIVVISAQLSLCGGITGEFVFLLRIFLSMDLLQKQKTNDFLNT